MDTPPRRRIVGVDVARGLAILGMFTAHLGNHDDLRLPNGSSWFEAADGRSAAGFALLAGVSAALLSGGRRPYTGARMRHARVRVVMRAALLWPLGSAILALNTPVVCILPTYAVLFAVIACVLHLRPRTLLIMAAGIMAVAPPVVLLARDEVYASGRPPIQLVDVTIGYFYPAAIWVAYLLVGLAVGRMDLRSAAVRTRLLVVGVVAAAIGLATNAIAMRSIDESHTLRRALLTSRPHSSSAVELLANIGVVLAVLALCLMVADRFPRAVDPLAATGALALTAYVGHIVAIATTDSSVVYDRDSTVLLAFIGVTVAFAWLWRTSVGRGPLETVLHRVSTAVADRLVPAGRSNLPAPQDPSAPTEQPAQDQPMRDER